MRNLKNDVILSNNAFELYLNLCYSKSTRAITISLPFRQLGSQGGKIGRGKASLEMENGHLQTDGNARKCPFKRYFCHSGGGGCSCLPLTSLLPLGLEENTFMMWIISICLFRAVKIMEQGVTFQRVLNSLRYNNNVSQRSNNCMKLFCF